MRLSSVFVAAAVLIMGTAQVGQAAPLTIYDTDLLPPGFYNGSGNPNGGFTVVRDGGVEVGLRVKGRHDPNVIHTPNQVYHVPAGSQPGVPSRGWWNHEWSIHLDPAAGLTLQDVFPYSTYTVADLTAGVSNTVSFPQWHDNAYWGPSGEMTGSAANNYGQDLFDDHYGAQNSGNGVFGDFPLNQVPGYVYDMNAEHYYRITLELRNAAGASLLTNSIDVAVGQAVAPVPEPASVVLLGLGALAFARARRSRR
jgi:hypothetical protein